MPSEPKRWQGRQPGMIVPVIALNTFREAVRDKILYVLLVFGILMILVSRAIGWVSFGGENKIMTDIGLGAIWMFSGMVSIFIGTGLIYKEIDKRTIYTILAKPAERWQFLAGKYLGLVLTTLVNLLLLSALFLAYLWFCGAPVTLALGQALFLNFVEMMVVTAVAILFSSASTPIMSAIFTTIVFFAGQLTKWVVDLGFIYQQSHPWHGEAAALRCTCCCPTCTTSTSGARPCWPRRSGCTWPSRQANWWPAPSTACRTPWRCCWRRTCSSAGGTSSRIVHHRDAEDAEGAENRKKGRSGEAKTRRKGEECENSQQSVFIPLCVICVRLRLCGEISGLFSWMIHAEPDARRRKSWPRGPRKRPTGTTITHGSSGCTTSPSSYAGLLLAFCFLPEYRAAAAPCRQKRAWLAALGRFRWQLAHRGWSACWRCAAWPAIHVDERRGFIADQDKRYEKAIRNLAAHKDKEEVLRAEYLYLRRDAPQLGPAEVVGLRAHGAPGPGVDRRAYDLEAVKSEKWKVKSEKRQDLNLGRASRPRGSAAVLHFPLFTLHCLHCLHCCSFGTSRSGRRPSGRGPASRGGRPEVPRGRGGIACGNPCGSARARRPWPRTRRARPARRQGPRRPPGRGSAPA